MKITKFKNLINLIDGIKKKETIPKIEHEKKQENSGASLETELRPNIKNDEFNEVVDLFQSKHKREGLYAVEQSISVIFRSKCKYPKVNAN